MSSLLSKLLIAIVTVYKRTVSPVLGVRCRYYPSCSEYMVEAIRKKGPFLGTLKGLWRILRCNPLFPGGHDPVA